jgi:RES domain-containing protein
MEVYRISKCRFVRQLDGIGAFTYGGRWNSKGHAVIYTAGSRALSLIEALAHMERPPVPNFCRVRIFIPDDSIITYPVAKLPEGWQRNPAPDVLKTIGDTFIRQGKTLALQLPSAIVPDEFNYLINPMHARIAEVRILDEGPQPIDERLV